MLQMHHKILEQFTLFKQPSSWENCAGWFTSCKQKWYVDLPVQVLHALQEFTYISTAFGCHTILSDYQSRTVWTHSTWTYHWGLERPWHFVTTCSSPFQQNYEDISHILVYLWGILLDGGMTEKEIKSLCCLSTFAWTFPAASAEHFFAFAFLATTFWSKECVLVTGIECLMSSGSVTDVTGTLFRMRNTFCWTVRMNIWSDFAQSNSLSSHLSLRMTQLVWGPLWINLIFLVLPLL